MTPTEFRSARHALGLSLNALADRMGVTGRSIRRWEAGSIPLPTLAILAMRYLRRDRPTSQATATDNRPASGPE